MSDLTERHMLDALGRRYGFESFGARRYAVAEHAPTTAFGASAIADLIVVDCWRGRDIHPILGHEIKTARSDWLRELHNPGKALSWATRAAS